MGWIGDLARQDEQRIKEQEEEWANHIFTFDEFWNSIEGESPEWLAANRESYENMWDKYIEDYYDDPQHSQYISKMEPVNIQKPTSDSGTSSDSSSSTEQVVSDEPVIDDSFIVDDNAVLAEESRDSDISELGYDENRPLWEVYIDGDYNSKDKKLLYRTGIDDISRIILNPSLELAINEPGSFSFTILPPHALYEDILPMYTDIFVYTEGVEVFRGRVTNYAVDVFRQKSVSCEGDLGYLADALFKLYDGAKTKKKVHEFFKDVIEAYNSAVSVTYGSINGDEVVTKRRTFADGITSNIQEMVAANKQDPEITVEETSYKDAKSYLDDLLSSYGGYIRTKRLASGTVVVEYLDSYTARNSQLLYYGGTLQSLSISNSPGDICTVMIPEGDVPDDDSNTSSTSSSKKENITLSSAKAYNSDGFLHSAKSDELVWVDGVVKYGRIMKTQSFNGITKANSLLTRSILFMKEMIKSIEGSITVSAIDLHSLNKSWRPIYLGDSVTILSSLHGIKKEMMCMGIKYNIATPDATEYTFSVPYHLLSGSFSKQYKKNKKKTDRKVSTASKNATAANEKASDAQTSAQNALSKVNDLSSKFGSMGTEFKTGTLITDRIKLGNVEFTKSISIPVSYSCSFTGKVGEIYNEVTRETFKVPLVEEDPEGGYTLPLRLRSTGTRLVIGKEQ